MKATRRTRAPRTVRPRSGTRPAGRRSRPREAAARVAAAELQEIEALRSRLEDLSGRGPARWNANPDEVRRSVVKLVLTLVEFIRQLLERQAIRRMEAQTMTAEQTEAVGLALMRLEETIRELAAQFGLAPEDLNMDLGPAGKLL